MNTDAERKQHADYMRDYYRRRRASDPDFVVSQRDRLRAQYHKTGKKTYLERKAAGLCVKCGKPNNNGHVVCPDCKRPSSYAKKRNDLMWNDFLDHYGRECACCGESNPLFLSIDHVNNDGADDRRRNGGYNYRYYVWIHARNTGDWPDHLQTMCMNCNHGKMRNGGVCPHQVVQRPDLLQLRPFRPRLSGAYWN
jgi:hypothetical protein